MNSLRVALRIHLDVRPCSPSLLLSKWPSSNLIASFQGHKITKHSIVALAPIDGLAALMTPVCYSCRSDTARCQTLAIVFRFTFVLPEQARHKQRQKATEIDLNVDGSRCGESVRDNPFLFLIKLEKEFDDSPNRFLSPAGPGLAQKIASSCAVGGGRS